jgi:hypothetical protein
VPQPGQGKTEPQASVPKVSAAVAQGPHLADAIAAFNALGCGVTFSAPGPRATYKYVNVSKYLKSRGEIHYEFLIRGDTISAELHVEVPKGSQPTPQQTAMQARFPQIVSTVNGHLSHLGLAAVIDPTWSRGVGGRVRVMMHTSGPAAHIAEAMQILIANS